MIVSCNRLNNAPCVTSASQVRRREVAKTFLPSNTPRLFVWSFKCDLLQAHKATARAVAVAFCTCLSCRVEFNN